MSLVKVKNGQRRDPIPYALETDWLAWAAGFEPLHLEIRSAELHPASTGFRRRSGAPLIRDAQVRVPPPGLGVLANSDSNMQRFESRRPSQRVCLQRITYEGRSKTARTAWFRPTTRRRFRCRHRDRKYRQPRPRAALSTM